MVNRKISENNLPCPVCKTNIPFDPVLLMRGSNFSCPNCKAVIGIAVGSRKKVSTAFDQMEKLSNAKQQ